jgi:hypothetical protein
MSEVISEVIATQPKPKATQRNPNDGRVLAEVERWMEMIREIKSEQVKN